MRRWRRPSPRTNWTGWTPRGDVVVTERRSDLTTRDRIDEIMAAVLRFGRQFRAIVVVGLIAGALAAAAFSAVLWKLDEAQDETRRAQQDIAAVVRQIQAERERNTRLSCESEKRQNAAIRAFVKGRVPPERAKLPETLAALGELDRTFPDRDCAREQRERVKGDRPE